MRREWVFVTVLLGAALWGGAAQAGNDPAATPATPDPATSSTPPAASTPPQSSTPTQGDLPLILSIRAMSLNQSPLGDTGDMDRVKASNGSGTNRWPSPSTPVARGVYISVMPSCIPGVDEPLFPTAQRPSAARRR